MLCTVLKVKYFSVTDRELSSNQEVKDSTLEEIISISSHVNQEGASPRITISQVSVKATILVAGEILNPTVGAFEGVANCRAVLHRQKPFGFAITAPLSRKAAQEGTSKSHEELHGKWCLNLIIYSFRVRFQSKVQIYSGS